MSPEKLEFLFHFESECSRGPHGPQARPLGLVGRCRRLTHCAHIAPSATLAYFLAWAPQVFSHCLQNSSPGASSILTPVSPREGFPSLPHSTLSVSS